MDFRRDLLKMKDDPHLVKLDADLKNILSSWFDIGLLDLQEINWDSPAKGLEESAGIMVNYYYNLPDIERNHEYYISESRVDISKDTRKWLAGF